MFMEEIKEIKEKIKEYFPESEFKIKYDSDEDEYEIFSNNEKKDMCLLFKIDEDHITIEQLNKCITSGKQNLINIENFAASMPSINYISLFDNSMLRLCEGVNIKLNIFLILCDNESWYNKKGYYSKSNHTDNQRNNIIQINRNIIDFLIECFEKKNIKDETKINQLLDGIQLFTSDDVKKLSVQGFFNIVKEIMKRESNFCQDKYIWLRNILIDIYFSKLLQYDVNLTKDIVKNASGIKRKRRSKKRKSRSKKRKTRSKKEKQRSLFASHNFP
jgi:hypothetical protein